MPAALVTHFVAIQRDITARKETERALRETNEKFHQLADNISDVFWIRSPDLGVVHYIWSPLSGFGGVPWPACMPVRNSGQSDFHFAGGMGTSVKSAFAGLTGDTPNIDLEYRIVRPDGEIRWSSRAGVPSPGCRRTS